MSHEVLKCKGCGKNEPEQYMNNTSSGVFCDSCYKKNKVKIDAAQARVNTQTKTKVNTNKIIFFENTVLASPGTLRCGAHDEPRTFDWCENNCPKYYSCDTVAQAGDEEKLLNGDAWECCSCGEIVSIDDDCSCGEKSPEIKTRERDFPFDSPENQARHVVLAFINDNKDKRIGLRYFNRETKAVCDSAIPASFKFWNLNINPNFNDPGRLDPKCCNVGDFPILVPSSNAPGAPLVSKNAGAWVLGEYSDGRLKLVSVSGQVKDVTQETAVGFHNKYKIANASVARTKLTPSGFELVPKVGGSNFPKIYDGKINFPAYDNRFIGDNDGCVLWTYWNPDGNDSKGQYIENKFYSDLILEVASRSEGDTDEFFDLIGTESKQYIYDNNGSQDFKEIDWSMRNESGNIQGSTYTELMVALIEYARSIEGSNKPSADTGDTFTYPGDDDKFQLSDNGRVAWIYWNPEGNDEKGQYVENIFYHYTILEAAEKSGGSTEDFFDFIGSEAKQYLYDNDGSADFKAVDFSFRNDKFDFTDCSTDTMNALIEFARGIDKKEAEESRKDVFFCGKGGAPDTVEWIYMRSGDEIVVNYLFARHIIAVAENSKPYDVFFNELDKTAKSTSRAHQMIYNKHDEDAKEDYAELIKRLHSQDAFVRGYDENAMNTLIAYARSVADDARAQELKNSIPPLNINRFFYEEETGELEWLYFERTKEHERSRSWYEEGRYVCHIFTPELVLQAEDSVTKDDTHDFFAFLCAHAGLKHYVYGVGDFSDIDLRFRDSDSIVEGSTDETTRQELIKFALSLNTAAQNGESFTIYQLKDGEETRFLRFESLESIKKAGYNATISNYNKIYSAPLEADTSLEDIFHTFNVAHPKDFTGHSLSVSDVVVLNKDGKETAFYVNSVGYQEIPDFFETPSTGNETTVITASFLYVTDFAGAAEAEIETIINAQEGLKCLSANVVETSPLDSTELEEDGFNDAEFTVEAKIECSDIEKCLALLKELPEYNGLVEQTAFITVPDTVNKEYTVILKEYPLVFMGAANNAVEDAEGYTLFWESMKLNNECIAYIDEAIKDNTRYGEMAGTQYVDTKKALESVMEKYGAERVIVVIATQISRFKSDGRVSSKNKQWASEIQIPYDIKPHLSYLQTHATILDNFFDKVREAFESVSENGSNSPEQIYGLLNSERMKAIQDGVGTQAKKSDLSNLEKAADIEVMKTLNEELKAACKAYYNDDDSPLSDYEYDNKFDELRALEAKTGVILPDSVTQGVGTAVEGKLPKVTHPERLLSLDKTKEVKDLSALLSIKAASAGSAAAASGYGEGVLAWKMDGLTIEATYEKGILKQAVTRGDGKTGEDVTHNAKFFAGLPRRISFTSKLRVRGEAVISIPSFERINASLPEGKEPYKNPRNLASGTVRRQELTRDGSVEFYAFSMKAPDNEKHSRYSEDLNFLRSLGFSVVHHYKVNANNVGAYVEKFKELVKTFDRPTDGLVLTLDPTGLQEYLGNTGHHPKWAKAFKWADEKQKTILREVFWSASRTGVLTPVAIFDPIELEGTTVKRASVSNLTILRKLKLGIGDVISVYKANMIIPQIAENHTQSDTCQHPAECPVCGAITVIRKDESKEDSSEFVVCTNSDCTAKNVGNLVHFVKREAMNIDGISEKSISELVSEGFISKSVDFYNLKNHPEIAELPGWGKASYNKLIYAVDNSRNVRLAQVIYALGIKNVGRSASDALAKHFKSIAVFMDAATDAKPGFAEDALSQVEGVGKLMVADIIAYFKDKRAEVEELIAELNIQNPGSSSAINAPNGVPQGSPNCLVGFTFCITGKVEFPGKRAALQDYISSLGGRNASSVTRGVDYLITNDPNSGSKKNREAQNLGCKVISEPSFMRLVQELSSNASVEETLVQAEPRIQTLRVLNADGGIETQGMFAGVDGIKEFLIERNKKLDEENKSLGSLRVECQNKQNWEYAGDIFIEDEAAGLKKGRENLQRQIDAVVIPEDPREARIQAAETIQTFSGKPLSGLTFCATGALNCGTRSDFHDIVLKNGGNIARSVTRGVDYLVTNTPFSGSNKNKSAQANGCRIISEHDFMTMLQGSSIIVNKVFYPGSNIPLTYKQLEEEAGENITAADFATRLSGSGHCNCPKGGEFELLPKDDPSVKSGGKRYMVCRICGGTSHL